MSMPKNGSCARTTVIMTPKVDDEAGTEAAREVCLGCRSFVECMAWAATLTEKTDPGGVIAATTKAEREAAAGSQTCTLCSTSKPITDFAFANRVRRVRRRECRTCVNRQGRAAGAVTFAKNRAERIARQVAA